MTEKLQQTIKTEIGKLPPDNQKVLNNFGWENLSEEICAQYELDEVALNNVQVEILLALIGVTDLEFFAINIENQAELTKPTAEKIGTEILEKILIPIQSLLLKKLNSSDWVKNAHWHQNVEFILSGGDYSVFLKNPANDSGDGPPVSPKN